MRSLFQALTIPDFKPVRLREKYYNESLPCSGQPAPVSLMMPHSNSTGSDGGFALEFPIMILGIEHTAIASSDPHSLADWYVSNLDFVVNYKSASSKTVFVKAPNGSMLEIIEANASPRSPQTLRDAGIRHLAIAVSDFDKAYARLKENGVEFLTQPETSKGNRVVCG